MIIVACFAANLLFAGAHHQEMFDLSLLGNGRPSAIYSDSMDRIGVVFSGNGASAVPEVRETFFSTLRSVGGGMVETKRDSVGDKSVVGMGTDGTAIAIDLISESQKYPWNLLEKRSFASVEWLVRGASLDAALLRNSVCIVDRKRQDVRLLPVPSSADVALGIVGGDLWTVTFMGGSAKAQCINSSGTIMWSQDLAWPGAVPIQSPRSILVVVPIRANAAIIVGGAYGVIKECADWWIGDSKYVSDGINLYAGVLYRNKKEVQPIGRFAHGYPGTRPVLVPARNVIASLLSGTRAAILVDRKLYVVSLPNIGPN